MKRNEKIALLTKLVQGKAASEQTREQLRDSLESPPIIGIIRPNPDGTHCQLTQDDEVTIQEGINKITIRYGDLEAYAVRKNSPVIFVFPDNGRG